MAKKTKKKGGKKKGGKKKGGKKKEEKAPEPDEFTSMDAEQLQLAMKKYNTDLTEIRRNRNYYMLEKDQVQQFHEIVHDDVIKTQSHIRNIESQMERMQDTHRNDIRIYLQKVIHLEFEHTNNVDAVSTIGDRDRANEEEKHLKKKEALKKAKLQLKADLLKEEEAYEEEIANLKETERKEMMKLREEFEKQHKELQDSYDNRLDELKNDLELRRKMEIHEIEERKNRHINDLMSNHERAFKEMKQYYNSITQDNLALIKSLNDEIADLKVKHVQNEKHMEEIRRRNEQLTEPLQEAEANVKELREELQNYEKDKASLKHAKSRLVVLEDHYKSLADQHKELNAEYARMQGERDQMYQTFEETVIRVQQKSGAKNVKLEQMLYEYQNYFEQKKAQFTSVLRASNLDPVVLQNVTKKLDDVLSSKNEQIEEMKYEIAKVTKAHDDLVRVYEAKLSEFGIPDQELHLRPLLGATGTAPADLIV